MALAQFVMPSEYVRSQYPGPDMPETFQFQNGDAVLVEVYSQVRLPHSHHVVPVIASAGHAVVQISPPPAP